MIESTNVSLNLQSPNIATVVYAVQNDRSSRHIVAQLLDGSAPWTPPAGATPVIRYLKPDGTGGFYDTDDNNASAIAVTGAVADMTLVEQTLTVPGDVYMQLNFYSSDGTRLTTFCWILRVQKSVLDDATIVSSDYFNALTQKITEGAAVAQQLTFPVPVANGGTGAANATDAAKNLNVLGLDGFTSISAGDDLNNYITPGVFVCGASATSQNVANSPVTNSGYRLIVMRILGNRYLQIAVANSTQGAIYKRYSTALGATWSDWYSSVYSDSLPVSIPNGGTGATTAADARTALGLGSVATENIVPIAKGGTGETTATAARASLGALDASLFPHGQCAGGGTVKITFAYGSRGLFMSASASSDYQSLYIINARSNGTVDAIAIKAAGASLNLTTGTGYMQINPGAATGWGILMFDGSAASAYTPPA